MDPITMATLGVSIFTGLMGSADKRKADQERKAVQKQQLNLAEADYALQLQNRQKWNEMYGSVEHNMIQYVKGLDASDTYRKAEGNIKAKFDEARSATVASLADRGLDVAGGVTAEAIAQLGSQEAQFKLEYQDRIEADHQQQRQSLVNSNQQPQNPSTANMSNVLGNNMANDYKSSLDDATQWGEIGAMFNKGVKQYGQYQKGLRADSTIDVNNPNANKYYPEIVQDTPTYGENR